MSAHDDDLRALIAALEVDALDDAERARAEAALAEDPRLATLRDEVRAALADPEPGPLLAPATAWDGIAARIAEVRAEGLIQSAPPISLRCTFCHDALERPRASYCASCLAPHHTECFADHGACAAPGCGETQVVQPALPIAPAPRRGPVWAAFAAAAALAVGAAAFAAWGSDGVARAPAGSKAPAIVERTSTPEALPADGGVEELLRSVSDHLELYGTTRSQAALERAEEEVQAALERAPGRPRAYLLQGLVRLAAPAPDLAQVHSAFERAVELDPDDPRFRDALAWSCLRLGLYEEAYAQCLAAQARSARPRLMSELGAFYALVGLNRIDQAQVALERAEASHPQEPLVWSARGVWSALTLDSIGALRAFERAAALNPRDPDLQLQLARTLDALERFEEALAAVARARELAPLHAGAQHDEVRLLLRLGRQREALPLARRAYDQQPGPHTARLLWAALRAVGEQPDAELLELAKQKSPRALGYGGVGEWRALLEGARAR